MATAPPQQTQLNNRFNATNAHSPSRSAGGRNMADGEGQTRQTGQRSQGVSSARSETTNGNNSRQVNDQDVISE